MGSLSTHVLDTAKGRPAQGLTVDLFRIERNERLSIVSAQTNPDGRTDAPLMAGEVFLLGTYELVFHVGDYFRRQDSTSGSPFLDLVPVRFTISEADGHYHVPLLVSRWSYSTYRGS